MRKRERGKLRSLALVIYEADMETTLSLPDGDGGNDGDLFDASKWFISTHR